MENRKQRDLGQYPTPFWVSESLVERHFSDLGRKDMVVEPSCGSGSFLSAIPEDVPAVGVEIDPLLADAARQATGRRIITGDFNLVELGVEPTCFIGNPPFNLATIERFLDRAHALLPDGGRVGFIVPAYAFQTSETVSRLGDRWSIAQEMLPRDIYHGLEKPLAFGVFRKDDRRTLVGFALYRETADLHRMSREVREYLEHATRSTWCAAAARALHRLGGQATLTDLYAFMDGRRPSRTMFWREGLRRTLRHYSDVFERLAGGVYALRGYQQNQEAEQRMIA